MKIECQREKLRLVVGLAERVTGKNLSLPVLARVLLSVGDHQISIRATNLDLGLEWRLAAKVEKPGEALVAGSSFSNFLSNLAGEEKIKMETVGENISLSSTRHLTLFKTYPLDDFPTLPAVTAGEKMTIEASDFLSGLRAVAYAAALNDIKPEIASVYLYHENDHLFFVATDSFRLAEKRVPLANKTKNKPKLIIPVRNVADIARVLEQFDGEISLAYDRHQLTLATEQLTLTSRLVDGVFPDYRQLVTDKAETQITLDRSELLSAVRVANIFTDRLNHISFKIRPGEQQLEIESRGGEAGENTTILPADVVGEELQISFNARYLLEGLQSVMAPRLLLRFNGRTKPITLAGADDERFLYLIMPINR